MKPQQKLLCNRIATAVMIIALGAFSLSSCTKKKEESNDGAKFVGTWSGTSDCGGATSFTLNAGSNGNEVVQNGTAGTTGCEVAITLKGTASGNTLVFPAQNFTDNCGISYTVSATATLNGNTLSLTQTATGGVVGTCSFTGTK